MKMEPLNNLQVAVKDNINAFYFSHLIPLNVHSVEDDKMESQVFLAAWKDIPNENELQFQIKECHLKADVISSKLQKKNSIYTIAKGNTEGHAVLTTFGSWPSYVTSQEIPIRYNLSLKCRAPEVSQCIYQV
ncbi:AP-1 complex subunit beta-1 [Myotis brandtii]|uniref:AP-1 complex subunit beta-1 n=1 Tax=Myotis brandtii TaxID=109478 RepID=S7Q1F8_MYOBR|nr:AP-1 complex subunit beta-1 [Myotis brandtii]